MINKKAIVIMGRGFGKTFSVGDIIKLLEIEGKTLSDEDRKKF